MIKSDPIDPRPPARSVAVAPVNSGEWRLGLGDMDQCTVHRSLLQLHAPFFPAAIESHVQHCRIMERRGLVGGSTRAHQHDDCRAQSHRDMFHVAHQHQNAERPHKGIANSPHAAGPGHLAANSPLRQLRAGTPPKVAAALGISGAASRSRAARIARLDGDPSSLRQSTRNRAYALHGGKQLCAQYWGDPP
jgi:hypothetical protein